MGTPVAQAFGYYFSNPGSEQDAIKTRLLNYVLFAVGLLPYYLLPIWAGVFAEEFNFTGVRLGPLLAADMVGGTIAALLARYWISRAPWQSVLIWSLLVCAIANVSCAFSESFVTLLALRGVAGLSAGTFMAIVYADFAQSLNPDRDFSFAESITVIIHHQVQ